MSTQISLRTQLRNVREELALLEANGQRGTEAFKKLQQEAGRLTDAIGDATTQARISVSYTHLTLPTNSRV